MLLADRGRVFMGLILYISGVQANSICALKGSSVDLRCSAQHSTSNMKWFTVHWVGTEFGHSEISADENHINISAESPPTLTISDLTKSHEDIYCCSDKTKFQKKCQKGEIQLQVTDLQVKAFPATEADAISLMCSSSCFPLTESPALYVWYKNRRTLYEDWSPWYQQLLSGGEAGNYSCAVKGYERLKAPEVSVDSVTPSCFTVTYAEGRMCSHQNKPGPCSITYSRDVHVLKTPASQVHYRLTCNTSCSLPDSQMSFTWYKNGLYEKELPSYGHSLPKSSTDSFSCSVRGHDYLLSDEICVGDENCHRVNYVSRRICALQGSSVDISSEYSDPYQSNVKCWFKKLRNSTAAAEELKETTPRIKYDDSTKNRHNLTINTLNMNDSGEYIFRITTDDQRGKRMDLPGVTLVVTDLRVRFTPSDAVTEGQRVTLTCSTSCPLTDDTNYIWYLNGQQRELTKTQSKHLVLDPVSSEHAGNYSCAVKGYEHLKAPEVSVDSVTESCFTVTYAEGRMCPHQNNPGPCSITYPRDLRVRFTPSRQRVTLTCSTSCPLPDDTNYIWYLNGQQRELTKTQSKHLVLDPVSSEHAGNYSCAVKGYEHLKAPEVSVDSVTESCFTVTYAEGRMCPHQNNPGPCSITYPRDLRVRFTPSRQRVTLTCSTSCPLTEDTNYIWYLNGQQRDLTKRQSKHLVLDPVSSEHAGNYSCAVKGYEHLKAPEVSVDSVTPSCFTVTYAEGRMCPHQNNPGPCSITYPRGIDDESCHRVNYVSRRICALQGSSVNISSEYSYLNIYRLKAKCWFKKLRNSTAAAEELKESAPRIKYHDSTKNRHKLTINTLNMNDSGEYIFRITTDDQRGKRMDLPGVTLVVTDLRVRFTPSDAVTEGQRVTLTCSTSCPLPDDTNYMWYLNGQQRELTKTQSKDLVLDPVSSEHAGNYSCAVENRQKRSGEKILTVHRRRRWEPAAAGVVAVLLVLISIAVFLWIRRRMTSSKSPRTESSDNLEEMKERMRTSQQYCTLDKKMISGHVYDVISAQPTEQEVVYENIVDLSNHADALFSEVQLHPPQEQEVMSATP